MLNLHLNNSLKVPSYAIDHERKLHFRYLQHLFKCLALRFYIVDDYSKTCETRSDRKFQPFK